VEGADSGPSSLLLSSSELASGDEASVDELEDSVASSASAEGLGGEGALESEDEIGSVGSAATLGETDEVNGC
jgi:hypothetical protein